MERILFVSASINEVTIKIAPEPARFKYRLLDWRILLSVLPNVGCSLMPVPPKKLFNITRLLLPAQNVIPPDAPEKLLPTIVLLLDRM